jgi:hypothetical protein
VGPRANMDGCGKSRHPPTEIRFPDRSEDREQGLDYHQEYSLVFLLSGYRLWVSHSRLFSYKEGTSQGMKRLGREADSLHIVPS